jgi:hypothetical protein
MSAPWIEMGMASLTQAKRKDEVFEASGHVELLKGTGVVASSFAGHGH